MTQVNTLREYRNPKYTHTLKELRQDFNLLQAYLHNKELKVKDFEAIVIFHSKYKNVNKNVYQFINNCE